MKESKKKLIGLLSTVGVCTVLLVGTAFAWYNQTKQVAISNLKVGVVSAYDLRFSFDDDRYFWNLAEDFGLNTAKQVSGNGYEFYKINTGLGTPDSDGVIKNVVTGYEPIDKEDYDDWVYYKEVHMMVEQNISLLIDHESAILPANKSSRLNYFNKSRDYIAGAVRFGISSIDDDYNTITPIFIWAPNSTYEYVPTEGSQDLLEEGTVETSYKFVDGRMTSNIQSIATNGDASGTTTLLNGMIFAWGEIPENGILLTNIPRGHSHFMFAVWIEGTDRECVMDFTGGEITANIKFTSTLS